MKEKQLYRRFVRPALRDIMQAHNVEECHPSHRVFLIFTYMHAVPFTQPDDLPEKIRTDWNTLLEARQVKPSPERLMISKNNMDLAKAHSLRRKQLRKVVQAFWNIADSMLPR